MELYNIEAFLDHMDLEGRTNRGKIRRNRHIIKRTAETDPSKSYEDAGGADTCGEFPPGVVLEDGRLIGFGIRIFNPDIYPIKEFEIYFRNCGLAGALDLSGQKDLLYVDLYHNEIDQIRVSGDTALQILGLQDNQIKELDVRDLIRCRGIDAGKNLLTELDVSCNEELVELYVNDNQIKQLDLSKNKDLKYLYCQNNKITELNTRDNPQLRHLDATGDPMKHIVSLAPQRETCMPLEVHAEGGGTVGMKFCPVYDAQWKETGKWQQTYFAYPEDGAKFAGWYDAAGQKVSGELVWEDAYGTSRVLTASFW